MIDDFSADSDGRLSDAMLGYHDSLADSANDAEGFASYGSTLDRRRGKSWSKLATNSEYDLLRLDDFLRLQNTIKRPALSWHTKSYRKHLEHSKAVNLAFGKEAIEAVQAGFITAYHEFEPDFNVEDANLLDVNSINQYLEIKIRSLFHTIADNYQIRSELSPMIGSEGGFEPAVAATIRKRIEIPGDLDQSFMDSVYWSVWSYISSGGNIGGDWGALVAVGKRLYMRIVAEDPVTYNDPNEFDLSFG